MRLSGLHMETEHCSPKPWPNTGFHHSVCPQSQWDSVCPQSQWDSVCPQRQWDSVCPQSQCVSSETVRQCVSSESVSQYLSSESVRQCVQLKLIIEATSWDSNVSHEESSGPRAHTCSGFTHQVNGPRDLWSWVIYLVHTLLCRGHFIYFYQMPPGGAVTYTLTQSQMFYQLFFLHLAAVTEFLLFWIMCLFSSDFYYRTVWSWLWSMRLCCQSNCPCLWLVIHSRPRPFYVKAQISLRKTWVNLTSW